MGLLLLAEVRAGEQQHRAEDGTALRHPLFRDETRRERVRSMIMERRGALHGR